MEPFGLIISKWYRRWYAIESVLSLLEDGLFSATTTCCKYFDYTLTYATYGRVGFFASLMTKEAEVIRFV
jgi:hypothetical protein